MRRLVLAGLCLFACLPLFSQIDNGNIRGRVTDSSGAVVPGAKVVVVHTGMNFETAIETNTEGLYRAQSLRPGPYRVTVTAPGFKRLVRDNLELRMGDTMAVDVTLELGALTESVQVSAAASLLETETSATGTVVTGDYMYRLPVYQRNVKAILLYTPGLTYNGLAWPGSLGSFHINGLRSGYIGFFEDGQLGTVGDGMATDTILNTIEDIKVLTTTLPAEYGHSAGGAISVVKKSGTNEVHGIASMFGRTRRMQHRKYFDLYRNSQPQPGWSKAPGLIFMQPDANLSGPVYIPKLYDGRNKTFFMVAFQHMLEKQSKQQVSTVPTLPMLNGDFNFGGLGQPVYDPRTTRVDTAGNWFRDPYPGNLIPRSQWDKVATNVLAMKPYLEPNVPGTLTATGPSQNIMTGPMKVVVWDNWSVRLDQQFTPNLKAYGTWTYNSRWERQPPWTIANDFFDFSKNRATTKQNTTSVGSTWVVSPTLVNEVRAGYYRYDQRTVSIAYMQDYAGQIGMPNLPKDTMPQIWPGGFTESLNIGGPSTNVQEILTLKDDMSKVQGTHTFKWGYELLRWRQNNYTVNQPAGSYTYTGTTGLRTNGTALPNTGNTFANFLTGGIASASYSRTINTSLPRVWQHSFYFQDDWKVTPRLTLNIGIRYNVETPPSQKYGLISIWDPNAIDDSVYTNYTCPAGGCKGAFVHPYGSRAYNFDLNRWDPRFGLAWQLNRRNVVRGGFAMTHVDMRGGFLYTDELMAESTNVSQAPGVPVPLFYLQNGPPNIIYPARRPDGSVPWRGNPGGHGATIAAPDMQAAYTMSWNFGVQTELAKDYMLEVQYKGSAQVRNSGTYNLNSLPFGMIPDNKGGWTNLNLPENAALRNTWLNNPQVSRPWNAWGDINYAGNNGHLNHHEGMIKLEKRFSRGLNFLAFYTLQKTLEGNSGNPYLDWRLLKTRSNYDQRHNFTGTMNYELPIGKGRRWLNRGGWTNYVIGGWDTVWTYTISSGAPLGVSISGANTQQYPGWMPNYGNVILVKNPSMRDGWQDLGSARFNQNTQNQAIDCGAFTVGLGNECFTYRPSFTIGTDNAYLFDQQRLIAASFSLAKEVPIRERARFQIRLDYQNPFKWYNWGAPATALAINSVANSKTFGTYTPGSEATTASYGGLPMMNLTLAIKW